MECRNDVSASPSPDKPTQSAEEFITDRLARIKNQRNGKISKEELEKKTAEIIKNIEKQMFKEKMKNDLNEIECKLHQRDTSKDLPESRKFDPSKERLLEQFKRDKSKIECNMAKLKATE